ncbi:hypothetical protein Ccrd_025809 [Cynara cardunculus var. scolymus]|uniref:Uncharacterized protein n=1 Tax=Cynara cardunculus var. scolymus TaxID=59895 RepID=A0A118ITZ7_CYNCS|nr:hypothetical protein Ccrd_025809 [Cynara cardunculus var. scolymus]
MVKSKRVHEKWSCPDMEFLKVYFLCSRP